MDNYRKKLHQITTFILDFDGVLSDGKILVTAEGEQLRSTDVKDGYALNHALKQGYRIAVISGGYSDSMRLRFNKFSGMEFFLGISNKVETFKEYLHKNQLSAEEVLYIGDDIPDYDVMNLCGLKCCPSDACREIKDTVDYISHKEGGRGCVRDIIEQTLKAQGKWFNEGACIW